MRASEPAREREGEMGQCSEAPEQRMFCRLLDVRLLPSMPSIIVLFVGTISFRVVRVLVCACCFVFGLLTRVHLWGTQKPYAACS